MPNTKIIFARVVLTDQLQLLAETEAMCIQAYFHNMFFILFIFCMLHVILPSFRHNVSFYGFPISNKKAQLSLTIAEFSHLTLV